MKIFWSKNLLLLILFVTNITTGAYLLNEKSDHENIAKNKQKLSQSKAKSKPRKKGTLNIDGQLQSCYNSYLNRRADGVKKGKVVFHWKISKAGKIDYIELQDTDFNDSGFANCIKMAVKNNRFSPTAHRGGAMIAHKFNFSPATQNSLSY